MKQTWIEPSLEEVLNRLSPATRTATLLVLICNAGASMKLRRDYAVKWWSEFLAARVTIAARLSANLSEFTAQLTQRLGGQIGAWEREEGDRHREWWREMLGLFETEQREILDVLETQASVCVTLVRAHEEAKKERLRGQKEEQRDSGDSGTAFFADRDGSVSPAAAEAGV